MNVIAYPSPLLVLGCSNMGGAAGYGWPLTIVRLKCVEKLIFEGINLTVHILVQEGFR